MPDFLPVCLQNKLWCCKSEVRKHRKEELIKIDLQDRAVAKFMSATALFLCLQI